MENKLLGNYKHERETKGIDQTAKDKLDSKNAKNKIMRTIMTTMVDQTNLPSVLGFSYFDIIPDTGIFPSN